MGVKKPKNKCSKADDTPSQQIWWQGTKNGHQIQKEQQIKAWELGNLARWSVAHWQSLMLHRRGQGTEERSWKKKCTQQQSWRQFVHSESGGGELSCQKW